MRLFLIAVVPVVCATAVPAAMSPRGKAIPIACTGPVATAARAIAKGNGLKHGQHPKACFGKMQIYDGPNFQYVVSAPAAACRGGGAIDVYERSRAGSWHSFFEKPVCGASVSIGPKDPWGDWMLSIDGRHYDSKGAYYVPVDY